MTKELLYSEQDLYMRIAIMQPYFLPYAGYFRLFQEADLFVIYDCVQFIRRGWIHRNRFTNIKGELSWLTLPLKKAPQEIRLSDLGFAENAELRLFEQQNKFPIFHTETYLSSEFKSALLQFSLHPITSITNLLELACNILKIPFNVLYSSQLKMSPHLRSQERIIAICKHFNANIYINSPGGKNLYNEIDFKQNNIILKFLPQYSGSYESILPRLLNENTSTLRNEIVSQGMDAVA